MSILSNGTVALGMVLLATAGGILGCSGTGTDGSQSAPTSPNAPGTSANQTPASIAVSAGNNQSAAVATAVSTPPAIVVKTASGVGLAGVSVSFTVGIGGGTVVGGSQTTNASGVATVGAWTLGATPGANTLVATAAGLNGSAVTFTATATTPSVGAISKVAGDGRIVQPGTPVSPGPTVRVTDANANPMAGIPVTFIVTSGGGTTTGGTVSTNSSGVAGLRLRSAAA